MALQVPGLGKAPSGARLGGNSLIRGTDPLTYPEAFKFDMVKETREFYKLFLDLELTDEQIYKILGRGAE